MPDAFQIYYTCSGDCCKDNSSYIKTPNKGSKPMRCFISDTFLAPGCVLCTSSLSVPHLKLSFPLVCVCFLLLWVEQSELCASWAPPLAIIFIDADVRAIGSAFRSSHRQDRYLKRADATIPASPETIRVVTLTPSYYYSGRPTGKSLYGTFFIVYARVICPFPPSPLRYFAAFLPLYSPYCGDSGWMVLCHSSWRHLSEHKDVTPCVLKVV